MRAAKAVAELRKEAIDLVLTDGIDQYASIKIQTTSSEGDIKEALRETKRLVHPDKNITARERATAAFQKLGAIGEFLLSESEIDRRITARAEAERVAAEAAARAKAKEEADARAEAERIRVEAERVAAEAAARAKATADAEAKAAEETKSKEKKFTKSEHFSPSVSQAFATQLEGKRGTITNIKKALESAGCSSSQVARVMARAVEKLRAEEAGVEK